MEGDYGMGDMTKGVGPRWWRREKGVRKKRWYVKGIAGLRRVEEIWEWEVLCKGECREGNGEYGTGR